MAGNRTEPSRRREAHTTTLSHQAKLLLGTPRGNWTTVIPAGQTPTTSLQGHGRSSRSSGRSSTTPTTTTSLSSKPALRNLEAGNPALPAFLQRGQHSRRSATLMTTTASVATSSGSRTTAAPSASTLPTLLPRPPLARNGESQKAKGMPRGSHQILTPTSPSSSSCDAPDLGQSSSNTPGDESPISAFVRKVMDSIPFPSKSPQRWTPPWSQPQSVSPFEAESEDECGKPATTAATATAMAPEGSDPSDGTNKPRAFSPRPCTDSEDDCEMMTRNNATAGLSPAATLCDAGLLSEVLQSLLPAGNINVEVAQKSATFAAADAGRSHETPLEGSGEALRLAVALCRCFGSLQRAWQGLLAARRRRLSALTTATGSGRDGSDSGVGARGTDGLSHGVARIGNGAMSQADFEWCIVDFLHYGNLRCARRLFRLLDRRRRGVVGLLDLLLTTTSAEQEVMTLERLRQELLTAFPTLQAACEEMMEGVSPDVPMIPGLFAEVLEHYWCLPHLQTEYLFALLDTESEGSVTLAALFGALEDPSKVALEELRLQLLLTCPSLPAALCRIFPINASAAAAAAAAGAFAAATTTQSALAAAETATSFGKTAAGTGAFKQKERAVPTRRGSQDKKTFVSESPPLPWQPLGAALLQPELEGCSSSILGSDSWDALDWSRQVCTFDCFRRGLLGWGLSAAQAETIYRDLPQDAFGQITPASLLRGLASIAPHVTLEGMWGRLLIDWPTAEVSARSCREGNDRHAALAQLASGLLQMLPQELRHSTCDLAATGGDCSVAVLSRETFLQIAMRLDVSEENASELFDHLLRRALVLRGPAGTAWTRREGGRRQQQRQHQRQNQQQKQSSSAAKERTNLEEESLFKDLLLLRTDDSEEEREGEEEEEDASGNTVNGDDAVVAAAEQRQDEEEDADDDNEGEDEDAGVLSGYAQLDSEQIYLQELAELLLSHLESCSGPQLLGAEAACTARSSLTMDGSNLVVASINTAADMFGTAQQGSPCKEVAANSSFGSRGLASVKRGGASSAASGSVRKDFRFQESDDASRSDTGQDLSEKGEKDEKGEGVTTFFSRRGEIRKLLAPSRLLSMSTATSCSPTPTMATSTPATARATVPATATGTGTGTAAPTLLQSSQQKQPSLGTKKAKSEEKRALFSVSLFPWRGGGGRAKPTTTPVFIGSV